MKSKHTAGRRVRRARGATTGRSSSGGGPIILDFVQSQIEAFNDTHGGGVAVHKDAGSYTLTRVDDGIPVACLRATGQGLFEILYWNPYHERWQPLGSILELREALKFIADDPLNCFWR